MRNVNYTHPGRVTRNGQPPSGNRSTVVLHKGDEINLSTGRVERAR